MIVSRRVIILKSTKSTCPHAAFWHSCVMFAWLELLPPWHFTSPKHIILVSHVVLCWDPIIRGQIEWFCPDPNTWNIVEVKNISSQWELRWTNHLKCQCKTHPMTKSNNVTTPHPQHVSLLHPAPFCSWFSPSASRFPWPSKTSRRTYEGWDLWSMTLGSREKCINKQSATCKKTHKKTHLEQN